MIVQITFPRLMVKEVIKGNRPIRKILITEYLLEVEVRSPIKLNLCWKYWQKEVFLMSDINNVPRTRQSNWKSVRTDRKSFLTEAVDAIADAKFLAENDHRTAPLTVDQLLKIAEVYALLAVYEYRIADKDLSNR